MRPERRGEPARLVVGVLVLAVLTGGLQSAQAATSLGSLTFRPDTGMASDPLVVTTAGSGGAAGCPSGGIDLRATLAGPADWSAGVPLQVTTPAGIKHSADFSVSLQSIADAARGRSIAAAPGSYRVTLSCTSADGVAVGAFTSSLTIDQSGAWRAVSTAQPPTAAPLPTGRTAQPRLTTAPAPGTTKAAAPSTRSPAAKANAPRPGPSPAAIQAAAVTGTILITSGAVSGDPGSRPYGDATDVGETDYFLPRTSSGGGCPSGTSAATLQTVVASGVDLGLVADDGFAGRSSFVDTQGLSYLGVSGTNLVQGRYDVVLTCWESYDPFSGGQGSLGTFTGSFWILDDLKTWQAVDPSTVARRTSTDFRVSSPRVDLPATVTLTATVTPAGAVGSVQFQERLNGSFDSAGPYQKIGAKVALVQGRATVTVHPAEGQQIHLYGAKFVPTDPKKFEASAAALDSVVVVGLPVPPVPPAGGAVVSGNPRVGNTLTCNGTFTGAKSYAFQWLRNGAEVAGASAKAYRAVAGDKNASVQCRIVASDAYQQHTQRTSPAVKVLG